MKTFAAEVTQFMPNRRKAQSTELSIDVEPQYKDMRKHGCRFEAEVLRTGMISVTITNEDRDVDCEIVKNGPQVQEKLAEMLTRKRWLEEVHDGRNE